MIDEARQHGASDRSEEGERSEPSTEDLRGDRPETPPPLAPTSAGSAETVVGAPAPAPLGEPAEVAAAAPVSEPVDLAAQAPTQVSAGQAGQSTTEAPAAQAPPPPVTEPAAVAAPPSATPPVPTPPSAQAAPGAGEPAVSDRPEVQLGAAFAGGFLLALVIRRLGS